MRKVNIEKQMFGNWLVIKQLNYMYALCKCTLCKTEHEVKISNLKSGSSTRCEDCARKERAERARKPKEDLTGRIFGLWKPIKYIGKSKWICECQCDKHTIKEVATGDLKRGSTKSCGCLQFTDLTNGKDIIKYMGNQHYLCKCKYCNNEYISHRTNLLYIDRHCGCQKILKRNKTMLKKYGDISQSRIDNPRELWQQQVISSKESLSDYIKTHLYTIDELAKELNISNDRILKIIHKYELDKLVQLGVGSAGETELYNYISSITNSKVLRNIRNILKNNRELDIYIPDKKIAIEFNGTYWHSDSIKDSNYHQNKTIECVQKGIRLIHIFEYEWENNKEKIKDYLYDCINEDTSNRHIIYARNTQIKYVNESDTKQFLNDNHLYGYTNAGINIGTYISDELIGIITFGKPRFNSDFEYEVVRMCWKRRYIVVGGLAKMHKYFVKEFRPKSIISYTDISKFTGNSFLHIGYIVDKQSLTKPNYVWVDNKNNKTLTRYQTMKKDLVAYGLGTEDMTEADIMHSLGMYRVYNSGNIKLYWYKEGDN